MPPKSKAQGLREENFQFLREHLRDAAIDYGPTKPAPGSAAYRDWVERWSLVDALAVFEAAKFEWCTDLMRKVIQGDWPLTWAHWKQIERHLGEAHARWLKDSVAKETAKLAEGGVKSAKERAKKTTEWQEAVSREADDMLRKNPRLKAYSIAKTLADRGILKDLNAPLRRRGEAVGPEPLSISQHRAYLFLKTKLGGN